MTETGGTNWYVVQTQTNAEAKATQHLLRQDFGVYLPRFLKRRRHAGRTDTVARALFPGYLFVAIDLETRRWRSVNGTIGVRRLVCNGDAPAVVDPSIVEALRRREDERGFIELASQPLFAPGDRVRVTDGVFSSNLGIYVGMSGSQRVAILLDLLGRKVRVDLDSDFVTAA